MRHILPEHDLDRVLTWHDDGLLAAVEVSASHGGNVSDIILCPGPHSWRSSALLLGHLLDWPGTPPVTVALSQDGVDGAAQDLGVPRPAEKALDQIQNRFYPTIA